MRFPLYTVAMKIAGIVTLLLASYYLVQFLFFNHPGAIFGFMLLFLSTAIFIFLIEPQEKPNQVWFAARKYGYGWTPKTIEGWLIIVTYILLVLLTILPIAQNTHSISDLLINAIPYLAIIHAVLFAIVTRFSEKT